MSAIRMLIGVARHLGSGATRQVKNLWVAVVFFAAGVASPRHCARNRLRCCFDSIEDVDVVSTLPQWAARSRSKALKG